MGQVQTSGSILMNLLINGKDVNFGYELQQAFWDVCCHIVLIIWLLCTIASFFGLCQYSESQSYHAVLV